jgi:hypothetical protein
MSTYLFRRAPRILNPVRHVEVVQTMLPREFLYNVRSQEVKADVKQGGKALLVANVDKVRQKVFGDLDGCGRCRCNHGILVQLVLLAESEGLLPAAIFLREGEK